MTIERLLGVVAMSTSASLYTAPTHTDFAALRETRATVLNASSHRHPQAPYEQKVIAVETPLHERRYVVSFN